MRTLGSGDGTAGQGRHQPLYLSGSSSDTNARHQRQVHRPGLPPEQQLWFVSDLPSLTAPIWPNEKDFWVFEIGKKNWSDIPAAAGCIGHGWVSDTMADRPRHTESDVKFPSRPAGDI